MRIKSWAMLFFFLTGAFQIVADTYPPPGNLILNGDFESGFSGGWHGTYGLDHNAITPPPLSGNTVGIVNAEQNPMYQVVATQPGQAYLLQFYARTPDLGANGLPVEGESAVEPSDLVLLLSGSVLGNGSTFESFIIQNRTSWSNYSATFVATSNQTTISFEVPQGFILNTGNGPPQEISRADDTFMDNVSLIPVPEVFSTLGMFCLAGMILAGGARFVGNFRWPANKKIGLGQRWSQWPGLNRFTVPNCQ